jgi:hypothetical protein
MEVCTHNIENFGLYKACNTWQYHGNGIVTRGRPLISIVILHISQVNFIVGMLYCSLQAHVTIHIVVF